MLTFARISAAGSWSVRPVDEAEPRPTPDNVVFGIQAAVDKAAPGDVITVASGKYAEDVTITQPRIRVQGSGGSELRGTLRIEAPGARIINLLIQDEDHCVVFDPNASGCRIYFCRLVTTALKGVALEVDGADTSDMRIFENQIYNYGGHHPDTDRRGLKRNWRPLRRAAVGILVRAIGGDGPPLRIHHNRISGHRVGLHLESADGDANTAVPAMIWKNRVLANTIGMRVRARGCAIDENHVERNTSHGLIIEASGGLAEANVIRDNLGRGLMVSGATARNNVIAGNAGGAIVATAGARLIHNTLYGNGGAALATPAGTVAGGLIEWSDDLESYVPETPDPERPDHHADPLSALGEHWQDDLATTVPLHVSDAPFPTASGSKRIKRNNHGAVWRSIGRSHDGRNGRSFRAQAFVHCAVPGSNTNVNGGGALCLTADNRGESHAPDLAIHVDCRDMKEAKRFTGSVWDGQGTRVIGSAPLTSGGSYFVAIEVSYPERTTWPQVTFQLARAEGEPGSYRPADEWQTFGEFTYDNTHAAYARRGPAFKWVGLKWGYSPARHTGDWWGIDDIRVEALRPRPTRAPDAAAVRFVNNLVSHDGTVFEGPGRIEHDHNVYAGRQRTPRPEPHGLAGTVGFRNPAVGDFQLTAGSAGIDAALPTAEVTRDAGRSGRPVGNAPDVGAYESSHAPAAGRAWWVAPGGDDEAGDGSRAKPFQTVSRAARDARPDDRIYLAAGTTGDDPVVGQIDPDAHRTLEEGGRYAGETAAHRGSAYTITCAGAPGHPIRIQPAPGVARARDLVKVFEALKPLEMADPEGGKVIISGSSWRLVDCSHLVIEGLEFRESPHNVIHLGRRSSHVTIRDCVFINCPPSDPEGRGWHAGITGSGPEANDILIENNVFDRRPNRDWYHRECDAINPFEGGWSKRWIIRGNKFAGYEKIQLGSGGRLDASTLGSPPTYHLVEGNEIFECNRGIHIKSSDNIYRHNYIHDLVPGYVREWVGMMNRSGRRNVYDGNLVVGCPYAGILVLDHDNTVVNNVFVRCDTGVLVAYREFGATPAQNTRVYHNTIINSVRSVQVDPRCSAIVCNNVFYNAPGFQARPPTAPAIVAEGTGVYPLEKASWPLFGRFEYNQPGLLRAGHNLYWNAEPGYLHNFEGGHGNVHADPRFVDAAGGDYRLAPDSPARGAGRAALVGHDFDDAQRPSRAPDMGAFQFKRPPESR